MSVVVSYFNKKTRDEFLMSPRNALGKRNRCNFAAGTIIILSSLDEKVIWGVCSLKDWDGTNSPCREHHVLEQDIYSKEFAMYNKYDICISELRIFKNPVSYDDVRILVGGPEITVGPNNMWKGNNAQFAQAFIAGDDKSCVTRFKIWAQSLL